MITTVVIVAVLVVLVILAVRLLIKTFGGKGGGCHGGGSSTVKRVQVADKNEANYPFAQDFKIGGMSCDNCACNVEHAINSIDETWARVSWEDGTAHVLAKQPIEEEAIKSAVSDAGYYVVRSA